MTRSTFGGTVADFVATVGPGGELRAVPAVVRCWDQEEGGNRHTDLLIDGEPATTLPVPVGGMIPTYQGPDGVTEMWIEAGGPRSRIVAEGKRGIPGVNAVPTVEAMAEYVEDEDPNAFKDALSATYALGNYVDLGNKSGAVTVNPLTAGEQEMTLAGNVTITLGSQGRSVTLFLTQDATGGRTVTWPEAVRWSDDETPELSTAAEATDVVVLVRKGTGWMGFIAGRFVVPDVTPPTAPGSLNASPATNTATLTWTASSDNISVVGYERRLDSGSWTDIGLVLTSTITGLTPGHTGYVAQVRARDAAGNVSVAAAVTFNTPSLSYTDETAADSPSYSWNLQDAAGTTTPANTGSGSNAATATGVTFDAAALAPFAKSAQFAQGSASRITLPWTHASLAALTVETLIELTAFESAYTTIFTQPGRFALSIFNGGWRAQVTTTSGTVSYSFNTAPAANTRYHVALRYDGSNVSLWLNGLKKGQAAATGTIEHDSFGDAISFGGDTGVARYVTGRMAGARVYTDTALSDSRILAHAQAAGLA